jgi:hypothetical protein
MLLADYLEQKRLPGKVSLRRAQFSAALAGNKTMLVWLGKQWLDQRDHIHLLSEVVATRVEDPYKALAEQLHRFGIGLSTEALGTGRGNGSGTPSDGDGAGLQEKA